LKVAIESLPSNGFGLRFGLKIIDGYRAGNMVRCSVSENARTDINLQRMINWAVNTGYEVINPNFVPQ